MKKIHSDTTTKRKKKIMLSSSRNKVVVGMLHPQHHPSLYYSGGTVLPQSSSSKILLPRWSSSSSSSSFLLVLLHWMIRCMIGMIVLTGKSSYAFLGRYHHSVSLPFALQPRTTTTTTTTSTTYTNQCSSIKIGPSQQIILYYAKTCPLLLSQPHPIQPQQNQNHPIYEQWYEEKQNHYHPFHHHSSSSSSSSSWMIRMYAKRTKRNDERNDMERWYDTVDENATPDEVFWDEIQRQNNLIGNTNQPQDKSNTDTDSSTVPSKYLTSLSSSSNNHRQQQQQFYASTGTNSIPSMNPTNAASSYWTSSTTNPSSYSSVPSPLMNNLNSITKGSYYMQQQQSSSFSSQQMQSSSSSSSSLLQSSSNTNLEKITSPKSIEAALSRYEQYRVADNWINEEILERIQYEQIQLQQQQQERIVLQRKDTKDNKINSNAYNTVSSLEDELDLWAKEDDNENDATIFQPTNEIWENVSDETWDQWEAGLHQNHDGSDTEDSYNNYNNNNRKNHNNNDNDNNEDDRIRIDINDPRRQPSEFLFQYTTKDESNVNEDITTTTTNTRTNQDDYQTTVVVEEEEEEEMDDEEYKHRLAQITIQSERLERARDNEKATAFFRREPDVTEGLDRMWVSAIDNVCFKNLVGTFRNYGIQFADNFGDFEDGSIEDGFVSIEDIASRKARLVYEVTGLPCIASRTSFEIEPVLDVSDSLPTTINGPKSATAAAVLTNPRVLSGYRFNDVGLHVDYLCNTLLPLSEPDRVTCFKTCLCYYDGVMEIFDYGLCEVDLYFANSMRTFLPVAQAITEMMKTLELTFGLEYQPWLRKRHDEILLGRPGGGRASIKLRDRVLKEGKVLPNDIIDVSAFMDSMVDVNLMDECAKELADRFVKEKPSKILTVATTGLVVALPMAKHLQVPVVYARKERNVVMADTYIAAYSSKTVGKNRELLVSKSHIQPEDRVLVIDDFLSSGASQEALLRIIYDAGAIAVGVGVLLEKVYDSGRQSLSGFDIPIHSLCRIASVQSGVIQLMEEEGFDLMQKQKYNSMNAKGAMSNQPPTKG